MNLLSADLKWNDLNQDAEPWFTSSKTSFLDQSPQVETESVSILLKSA